MVRGNKRSRGVHEFHCQFRKRSVDEVDEMRALNTKDRRRNIGFSKWKGFVEAVKRS